MVALERIRCVDRSLPGNLAYAFKAGAGTIERTIHLSSCWIVTPCCPALVLFSIRIWADPKIDALVRRILYASFTKPKFSPASTEHIAKWHPHNLIKA